MAKIYPIVVVATFKIISTLKQLLPPCFFPLHTQEVLSALLPFHEKIFPIAKTTLEERAWVTEALQILPLVQKVYRLETNFLLVQLNQVLRFLNT